MLFNSNHTLFFENKLNYKSRLNLYTQYEELVELDKRRNLVDPMNFLPSPALFMDLENNYGITQTHDDFNFLIKSDFNSFFISNNVDIPSYFDHTKSVKRSINNIPILKFNNYFMRDGLRYKTLFLLNQTV